MDTITIPKREYELLKDSFTLLEEMTKTADMVDRIVHSMRDEFSVLRQEESK